MKKYFIIFGIIISSFFFSSSIVSATNLTYPYSSSQLELFDDSAFIDFLNNEIQNQSNTFLIYDDYSSGLKLVQSSNTTSFDCLYGSPNYRCYKQNGNANASAYNITKSNGVYTKSFSTTFSNWSGPLLTYISSSNRRYNNVTILYSSVPFKVANGDVITITDDVYTETCSVAGPCSMLQAINFYNKYYYVEPPPEPTLLDDFVSLVLEKLVAITEFISSNDIYLAIFVIFILYFVILLFRRLK